MEKIIDKYITLGGKTGVELELRFYLGSGQWRSIVNQYTNASCVFEKSITFSKNCPPEPGFLFEQLRLEKIMEPDKQPIVIKQRKSTYDIVDVQNGKQTAKLALSIERPEEFSNDLIVTADLIRVRVRMIVRSGAWTIHASIVKECSIADVERISRGIDPGRLRTMNDFLNMITPDKKLELEMEYTGSMDATGIAMEISGIVNTVQPVKGGDEEYNQVIAEVASIINGRTRVDMSTAGNLRVKDLFNATIEFMMSDYVNVIVPKIAEFYVCEKNDGIRGFLYIRANMSHEHLHNQRFIITDEYLAKPEVRKMFTNSVLLDIEYVDGRIYVIDVIQYSGVSYVRMPFSARLLMFDTIAAEFRDSGLDIVFKKFTLLTDYRKQLAAEVARVRDDPKIDGLIFTDSQSSNVDKSANLYKTLTSYKWKKQTTIDFLVIKPIPNMMGVLPYEKREGLNLYLLFNGISDFDFVTKQYMKIARYNELMQYNGIHKISNKYYPIHFQPHSDSRAYLLYTADELDGGHIYEFAYESGTFRMLRARKDKDKLLEMGKIFGNDHKIAIINYIVMKNPITPEILANPPVGYFRKNKTVEDRDATYFGRYCKYIVMSVIENQEVVVDLAAGRGADLFTYNTLGIGKLIAVDIDRLALEDLTYRYEYSINSASVYIFRPKLFTNFALQTMQRDLTRWTTYEDDIPSPVDAVCIHFAIHYIVSTPDHMFEFAERVRNITKPYGYFIATFLDGRAVNRLLNDSDGIAHIGKRVIKKKYSGTTLMNYGCEIELTLPFTDEPYSEKLVNPDFLVENLRKVGGFECVKSGSFAEYERSVNRELSDDDKKFMGLYYYVILQKRNFRT